MARRARSTRLTALSRGCDDACLDHHARLSRTGFETEIHGIEIAADGRYRVPCLADGSRAAV